MDVFLKIVEWCSSLSTLPKVLLSIVILAIAGFLLAALWSTSTSKAAALPLPQATQLKAEEYYLSKDIESLRQRNGTALVEERQEGRKLAQVPKGTYGFCPPWMLNTDPVGVVGGTGVEKISLSRERLGTAVLEMHRDKEGRNIAIAYCSDDTATVIEDGYRKSAVHCVLYMESSENAKYAVSIPVANIVSWDLRYTSSDDVVDGVLL